MNKKKKVLFIVNSLSNGGAERVCINLAKKMLEEGYEVDFILLYNDIKYTFDSQYNINIFCLDINKQNNKYLRTVQTILKIKEINRYVKEREKTGKYELITSHLVMSHLITKLSFVRRRALYVIHNAHYQIDTNNSIKFKIGMKYLYKDKKIVTVSSGVKSELVNKYGLDSKNIEVIYNPINLDEINLKKNELINIKDKYILFVGRLNDVKRPDLMLDLFYKGEFYKKYKLVFVGVGEMQQKIINRVKKLGIEELVIFTGWQENVYKWMKNAEVMVVTSNNEAFPMNIIEALSCNTKVVSADCDYGPREILVEDFENYLVNKNNIEDYIVKINNAIKYYPKNNIILERCNVQNVIKLYFESYRKK